MPIRIYVCPMNGDGTTIPGPPPWNPATGPYRPVISDVTFNLSSISHPGKRLFLCCVDESDAILDTIEADSRVTAVIPVRATGWANLAAILNAPFSSYPLAWRNAARAKLEGWGVNTEWIGGTDTMRDVLRHLARLFAVSQIMEGKNKANALAFIMQNLDATVASIPAAQKNEIGVWLTSKGIDVSWITGTTTVRQVVHSIIGNVRVLYGRNVPIRFAGEVF